MSHLPWAAVVALKPATIGKSRLGTLPAPLRSRLASRMALDSLTALASATSRLVVVSDSASVERRLRLAGIPAEVIPDPRPGGLNNALRAGEAVLRAGGDQRVLACVGDLPALTADTVRAVIGRMTVLPLGTRGFVADHDGTGSTMLLADLVGLDPHFGVDSAAAHRSSGAVDLVAASESDGQEGHPDAGLIRARTDVDAPEDLPAAIGIGVGKHTASLITNGRLADYSVLTVIKPADGADRITAISGSGQGFIVGPAAWEPELDVPRVGDHLHAAVDGDRVISVWSD